MFSRTLCFQVFFFEPPFFAGFVLSLSFTPPQVQPCKVFLSRLILGAHGARQKGVIIADLSARAAEYPNKMTGAPFL
jgi:hypothetical protein